MKKVSIYLGGSENFSNWRMLLFPYLPSVKFVEPERRNSASNVLILTNTEEIDKALIHLHCITPVDCGLHVAAELMKSISTNPKGTILLIRTEENGKVFTELERKELYILVEYVNAAGGVAILNDISETVTCVHECIDKESYINSNKVSNISNIIDAAYNIINIKAPNYILGQRPKIYSLANAINYFLKDVK